MKAFPAGMVVSWVIITTARCGCSPFRLHFKCHDTLAALQFQAVAGRRSFATWDWVNFVFESSFKM